MGITRKLNGANLERGPLTVREFTGAQKFEMGVTPRIGITHAADWPLRFFIEGNRFVSGPKGDRRVRAD